MKRMRETCLLCERLLVSLEAEQRPVLGGHALCQARNMRLGIEQLVLQLPDGR